MCAELSGENKASSVQSSARSGGRSVALVGLGLGCGCGSVFLMISVIFLSPYLIVFMGMIPQIEYMNKAPCQRRLEQLGGICRKYAEESKERLYPELSAEAGRLMFSATKGERPVYPDYLIHLNLGSFYCPENLEPLRYCVGAEESTFLAAAEQASNDQSYFYLGYFVANEMEMQAFAEAYKKRIAAGLPFHEDLKVPPGQGNGGGDILYRLRSRGGGFNKTPAEDSWKDIPIMIERLGNHKQLGAGGYVLYLDGHAAFCDYPGEWPMSEMTMGILESLDKVQ